MEVLKGERVGKRNRLVEMEMEGRKYVNSFT